MYTENSNSQISEYLAFHSQSYFVQMFRKKTGITPGRYRSQHGLIR
ncbi:MAG: AraC family transcriptional regulator [Lachnospiraceae bacterium]|nr:AraC family transcriptional regulator [Lachnospiraceae bacterium]